MWARENWGQVCFCHVWARAVQLASVNLSALFCTEGNTNKLFLWPCMSPGEKYCVRRVCKLGYCTCLFMALLLMWNVSFKVFFFSWKVIASIETKNWRKRSAWRPSTLPTGTALGDHCAQRSNCECSWNPRNQWAANTNQCWPAGERWSLPPAHTTCC